MPEKLQDFIDRYRRLFVLTGAGCSTDSGIPDYRDADGEWKRAAPVMFQNFMANAATRARYWARSMVGWPLLHAARPNGAHRALAALQRSHGVELLATQNVDGLHQLAGSRDVIDLHGRIDTVRCMNCDYRCARQALQLQLQRLNAGWDRPGASIAPDGDADVTDMDFAAFDVPRCPQCGGILKPDVVFFGEIVPPARVSRCMSALGRADAMLIVGTSLMVYSGYRFAQAAAEAGKPIAAVNLGRTRADELISLKVEQSCATALAFLL